MDYGTKLECHVCIEEAILEVHKVMLSPSEQLHLEKVLTASGAKYPLVHVVTQHLTLATGASTADADALFNGKIPTKVIIGLVSKGGSLYQGLACPVTVQHVLQRLERWFKRQPFHGQRYAVVLGPDAQWQWRCGLPVSQTSGHRESQPKIRQASAGNCHTHSLSLVWWPGDHWCLPHRDLQL